MGEPLSDLLYDQLRNAAWGHSAARDGMGVKDFRAALKLLRPNKADEIHEMTRYGLQAFARKEFDFKRPRAKDASKSSSGKKKATPKKKASSAGAKKSASPKGKGKTATYTDANGRLRFVHNNAFAPMGGKGSAAGKKKATPKKKSPAAKKKTPAKRKSRAKKQSSHSELDVANITKKAISAEKKKKGR